MTDEVCDNLTVNKISNLLGDARINDRTIYLRPGSDSFHGLGWFGAGKLFANYSLDGPVLFGFHGGALGTTNDDGQNVALSWDQNSVNANIINAQMISINEQGGAIKTPMISLKGLPKGETFGIGAGIDNIGVWADSTGRSDIFVIKNTGRIGINTGSPKEVLDVNGNISVSGDILLAGADCAEDFDIVGVETVQPGTVMVIDNDGALRPGEKSYDKRVAGVISGAGNYRPGITLDKQNNKANRLPLALTGKVYCKVDADYGPIEVGDLLTTSTTIGHAMKAIDSAKAFGSVIGKALRPVETGRGIIPILIALQ